MEYIVVVICWGDGGTEDECGRNAQSIRCHTKKAADLIAHELNASDGVARAFVVED